MENSINIFDKIENIIINGNYSPLFLLQQLIIALIALGWEEHTGDWDPYAIWELNDGSQVETASGYPEFDFDNDNQVIKVTIDSEVQPIKQLNGKGVELLGHMEGDEPEIHQVQIDISEIKKVSLIR